MSIDPTGKGTAYSTSLPPAAPSAPKVKMQSQARFVHQTAGLRSSGGSDEIKRLDIANTMTLETAARRGKDTEQALSTAIRRKTNRAMGIVEKVGDVWQNWNCQFCNTNETPELRRGPNGSRTLCNRCGLRWGKQEKSKSEAASKAMQNVAAAAPAPVQAMKPAAAGPSEAGAMTRTRRASIDAGTGDTFTGVSRAPQALPGIHHVMNFNVVPAAPVAFVMPQIHVMNPGALPPMEPFAGPMTRLKRKHSMDKGQGDPLMQKPAAAFARSETRDEKKARADKESELQYFERRVAQLQKELEAEKASGGAVFRAPAPKPKAPAQPAAVKGPTPAVPKASEKPVPKMDVNFLLNN